MGTLLIYGLVAVILGGALFLVAAVALPAGEQIAPPIRDEPPWDLPAARRLDAADVIEVRLPVALRGYRFAETDLLLDRLADELRERDLEIKQLKGIAPEEAPESERAIVASAWRRWVADGVAEGSAVPDVPAPDGRELAPGATDDEPGPGATVEVEIVPQNASADDADHVDEVTDVAIDDDTVLDPDLDPDLDTELADPPAAPARGRRRHGR